LELDTTIQGQADDQQKPRKREGTPLDGSLWVEAGGDLRLLAKNPAPDYLVDVQLPGVTNCWRARTQRRRPGKKTFFLQDIYDGKKTLTPRRSPGTIKRLRSSSSFRTRRGEGGGRGDMSQHSLR